MSMGLLVAGFVVRLGRAMSAAAELHASELALVKPMLMPGHEWILPSCRKLDSQPMPSPCSRVLLH